MRSIICVTLLLLCLCILVADCQRSSSNRNGRYGSERDDKEDRESSTRGNRNRGHNRKNSRVSSGSDSDNRGNGYGSEPQIRGSNRGDEEERGSNGRNREAYGSSSAGHDRESHNRGSSSNRNGSSNRYPENGSSNRGDNVGQNGRDRVTSKPQKGAVSEEQQLREGAKHPLTDEDFKRAKNLPSNLMSGDDKILYSGGLFEGDIADNLLINDSNGRNALRNPGSRWPGGVVPYVLSPEYSPQERAVIARAMQEYHENTCIRFRPQQPDDNNYVFIQPGSGCSSRVGMTGGMQPVSLGRGCVVVGIVEHELMHALGFVHEQSRSDRDEHVQILYENVQRGLENNFRKYTVAEVDGLNEPYDYGSVLHYSANAFTNGNGPTIVPRQRNVEIGQRRGFSPIDLRKINKLYQCEGNIGPSGFGGGRPSGSGFGPGSGPGFRPGSGSGFRPGAGSIGSGLGGLGSIIHPSRPSISSILPGIGGVGGSGSRLGSILPSILRPGSGILGGSSGYRPGSIIKSFLLGLDEANPAANDTNGPRNPPSGIYPLPIHPHYAYGPYGPTTGLYPPYHGSLRPNFGHWPPSYFVPSPYPSFAYDEHNVTLLEHNTDVDVDTTTVLYTDTIIATDTDSSGSGTDGNRHREGNRFTGTSGSGDRNREGDRLTGSSGNGDRNREGDRIIGNSGNGDRNREVDRFTVSSGSGDRNREGGRFTVSSGSGDRNREGGRFTISSGSGERNRESDRFTSSSGNGERNREGDRFTGSSGSGERNRESDRFTGSSGSSDRNREGDVFTSGNRDDRKREADRFNGSSGSSIGRGSSSSTPNRGSYHESGRHSYRRDRYNSN